MSTPRSTLIRHIARPPKPWVHLSHYKTKEQVIILRAARRNPMLAKLQDDCVSTSNMAWNSSIWILKTDWCHKWLKPSASTLLNYGLSQFENGIMAWQGCGDDQLLCTQRLHWQIRAHWALKHEKQNIYSHNYANNYAGARSCSQWLFIPSAKTQK